MRFLKYICLLAGLFTVFAMQAQYNPVNPPEPGGYTVTAKAEPSQGGSVSPESTVLQTGEKVTFRAYAASNYRFVGWEDAAGVQVSASASYTFTVGMADASFVARFVYSPGSPAEPDVPERYATVSASVIPATGGSVSGTGRHAVGSTVRLYAYANSDYKFVNWTRGSDVLGTSTSLSYTVLESGNDLVANFIYAPSSPSEPTVPLLSHRLYLECMPAGSATFNRNSGDKVAENESVSLYAYASSGYVFRDWTDESGQVVSTERSLRYTMPARDVRLRANMVYSPDNPSEPDAPQPGRNVIYGARELAMPGADFIYTISLENADHIIGMNIDIVVPELVKFDMDMASLSARAGQHTLGVEAVDATTYRLTVRGTAAFDGANGPVIRIPAHLDASAEVDTGIAIDVAHGVVFKDDGSQTPVDAIDGIVKVIALPETLPDSPDFIVSDIRVLGAEVMPGDNISLDWMVENIGNIAATGGWSESVFLVGGDGRRTILGTIYYEGENLAAGAKVTRSATLAINSLPGISGRLNAGVSVVPYATSGEIEQKQLNNTTVGKDYPITLGKRLVLEIPANVTEGSDRTIRGRIARSGSWAESETFTLSAADGGDPRLTMPESVTIIRDQSAAYFQMSLADNDVADGDASVTVSATGAGYDVVSSTMAIVDDEFPAISIEATPDEVAEGQTFTLTVTLPAAPVADLDVALGCDAPARITLPASVTVKAGTTTASVTVTVTDNTRIDGDAEVTLRATAPRYMDGETYLTVLDNDIPALEMEILPAEVSESAGPSAMRGILRRTDNFDKRVTVILSDNSAGELYYSASRIELGSNVRSAEFSIGVIDNNLVDGDRNVDITAAVYISSCSCAATGTGAGVVTKPVRIIDNDGPALSIESAKSTILEGDSEGILLTVSRNTDTSQALTVTLSSDADDVLIYDHTVIIPVGHTSASVRVTAPANATEDDNRTVVFSAEAEGFSKGTFWAMVTDSSLPDATVESLVLSASEVKVGQPVEVSVIVVNAGSTPLPEITKTTLYLSNEAVASLYTQKPLAPGEKVTLKGNVVLPATVGKFDMQARINEGKSVKELLYTNNNSSPVPVTVLPPFTATVSVDGKVFEPAREVKISGQLSGDGIADADVEVYVINAGTRQTIPVRSDASGRFEAVYTPYSSQLGHFAVGACYPGEQRKAEDASFDIYGLTYDRSQPIICRLLTGVPYSGKVRISNPGVLPLGNVAVTTDYAPSDVTVDASCASTIAGGGAVDIDYTLTASEPSSGSDWREVKLRVTSAEAGDMVVTLYYFAHDPTGTIRASIPSINTTVTEGSPSEYPFVITNSGQGPTGRISLTLPEWMSSVTPLEMPSLAPGDSATVILRLATNEKMNLNVAVTGHVGLRCDNGQGLSLPYNVVPVSDAKGKLEVVVCDEYTYYTSEAPHVAGARVVISNPSTGAVILDTVTSDNGICSMDMAAGYYQLDVTAEKHEKYRNYVYVSAGRTETVTVDISYNPITISWDVQETEVEDEYTVNTIVKYETNVPMPVVKITIPKSIDGDNMAVGDATMINMNMTNIGLIRAIDVRVVVPQDLSEWKFEPLDYTEPFELMPNQSVNVPVRITRIADESMRAPRHAASARSLGGNMITNFGNCMTAMGGSYKGMCGTELKDNTSAENLAMKACATAATAMAIGEILEHVFGGGWVMPSVGGGGGGGGTGGGGGESGYGSVSSKFSICDPCDAQRAEALIDKLLGSTWLGGFNDAVNDAIEAYRDGRGGHYRFVVHKMGEKIGDYIDDQIEDFLLGDAKDIVGFAIDVYELTEPCEDEGGSGGGGGSFRSPAPEGARDSKHSWVDEFNAIGRLYADQLMTMHRLEIIAFGDSVWFTDIDDEKSAFRKYAFSQPDGVIPPDEEIEAHRPQSVSFAQAKALLEHINGSGPNFPTEDELVKEFDDFEKGNLAAQEKGYTSLTEQFYKAYDDYRQHFEDMKSNSVCASITLQISQTMTMTRQAFRGTLTVFNGHEQKPMQDVRLNLLVRDSDGNIATSHEFQINGEKLDGFTGSTELPGGWELEANSTGTATILFIPTKYAAPDDDKVYSFGGTLSYLDPYTNLVVTRNLYPVNMTVKPSPELDLIYFMQRDVFADDPLTPDVIEPKIPAEFALIINNKGRGDATNVRMTTKQPEIIENEKGLLIDFEFVNSQLNGNDKVMALGGTIATDFGTIPAGTTSYAQWWLEASLLGHFVEYDVEATHVTSYGNPDLSLLDNVTIHELIHGFTADAGASPATRAFLVNDIVDSEDMPDMVYFSDGATELAVSQLSGISTYSRSQTEIELTAGVTDGDGGWYYGSTSDPTGGRQKLISVTRKSDGAEIPVDNFWQTECTLRDGKDPIHEARLHMVASLSGSETYVLTFEPRPMVDLEVKEFTGLPEDEVLYAPLEKVGITFNKAVDPSTFTADDISLTCAGKHVDVTGATVTALSDTDFVIAFGKETLADGYYVLTVATEGITDAEGFCGRTGKSASWIQYVDGKVMLTVDVTPAGAGTVSPISGRIPYGETVTFAAHPSEGYDFTGWMHDGALYTDNPEFDYVMLADEEFIATFAIRHYNVEILYDAARGLVENAASGIYEHGTVLEMNARALDGFTFDRWYVDDAEVSTAPSHTVTVKDHMTVRAEFTQSSGIDGINADSNGLVVSPAPLHDVMTVDGSFRNIRLLTVYEVGGGASLQWTDIAAGSTVGVESLMPGFYIVHAVTDSGIYVKKVLKQ
ncbi:InlB B-repeat-containing protein [Muribaculum intestinale]|jgi:hypothetical protein|uniref:InlB B-repeat-containing protein n=1 Tax=Muribaculum intestinale TaxID=1796646 RepID=UPI00242EC965|nr:CARDB domain-containing protein [Muribaculum intestinale]